MEIPPWNPYAPRNVQVTIPTEPNAKPPNRPLYRYSPREYEAIEAYITELLSKGLIQPRTSPYGAAVLFVPKPDGSLRMCIDYRALNKITLRNQEPIPNIADLLDRLSGAKYFTSLDLVGGYYQLPIHPSDIHKTAVKTPLGLYEFKILPMGLTNSPAVFQRAMNDMFRGKTKQTNKNLRCGNRKGLLSRNDQTHHRMGPKTMESIPPSKRNTQADIQLRTRQIVAPANKSPAGD